MTTITFEQFVETDVLDEAGSYLALVEQLAETDDDEIIEARDALAHEMAQAPEVYLPRQFEDLAVLYRDRTDQQRWNWSHRTEEVAMFVSRTPDCSHVEEQYARIDEFSAMNRHWQHTTYAVKVLRENGADVITVDEGTVTVRRYDETQGSWSVPVDTLRQSILIDFFYESLRATAMQLARTPQERASADSDAKQKLETMLYGGPKVIAAME